MLSEKRDCRVLDLAIVAAIARIQWQPMVPIRQPLNARLAIRANGLGAPWVRGKHFRSSNQRTLRMQRTGLKTVLKHIQELGWQKVSGVYRTFYETSKSRPFSISYFMVPANPIVSKKSPQTPPSNLEVALENQQLEDFYFVSRHLFSCGFCESNDSPFGFPPGYV